MDEAIKLENKTNFIFRNCTNDNVKNKEIEEHFTNIDICRFCERHINSDKVRSQCHLTGEYRGPAHNKCNLNVEEKQSNFNPFLYHSFSNYDCHLFFQKLVDKNNDKVKFDNIPKTNEEDISVTYGFLKFIDSYQFLSSSLNSLVETLSDKNHKKLKNLEKEIVRDVILNIVN